MLGLPCSPVLRLVGVVVWLMHIATEMASPCWTARKEFAARKLASPATNTNKSFKKSNIPSKRTVCSGTPKSSATGLSTRSIADAATRFRPLPEPHPAHCRNTFPDGETTTMIITITMSIRHPLAQPFCLSTQSIEAPCGKLTLLVVNFRASCGQVCVACGQVRVSCHRKLLPLRVFGVR